MKLARERKLPSEDIAEIVYRQHYRQFLAEMYSLGEYSPEKYKTEWEANEYELQNCWGFNEDDRYHKFWEMAGCTCPKMDNDDAYPTGYYTRDGSCPLHGEHTWQK